jgi:uncharacterized protein (TIGR02466 family)
MDKIKLLGMQPLFYSPLLAFEVPGHDALNPELLSEIAARKAASAGLKRSNLQGWHSEDDLFDRQEPACRTLCAHLLGAVQAATRSVSPDFDFDRHIAQAEGWMNVLGRGGLNTPHDHPNWVWSGCYYVQVPTPTSELGGSIEFFDVRSNVRTLSIDGAACFASKFTARPLAGTVLMFPSYLRHWVYPHDSDLPRVSIAFNARYARAKKR